VDSTTTVGKDGSIPAPRAQAQAEPDLIFQGLQVCSDGLVRDAIGAAAHEQVVADLRHRARRLRDTGEPFPANPYRLANELLDSGTVPHLPEDRDAGRELLARMYRDALHRALR
jgi:hypothetical protein